MWKENFHLFGRDHINHDDNGNNMLIKKGNEKDLVTIGKIKYKE